MGGARLQACITAVNSLDRALAPEVMFPSPQRLKPPHCRILTAPLNLDYSRACGGGANGERGWGKRVELVAASSHESKSFRGGGNQVQPGSKSERGKHTSAWAMQTGLFFGSQQNRFSRWPLPGRHSARAVERASRWRSAPPPGAPSGRSALPV